MPEVTPEQLRAMEDPDLRQQTQESIEKGETTVTPEATAQPETPESKLEAIQEKVELGQDLTEDEQKVLDELDKETEPDPEVKYRIAGTELSYAEAKAKMREAHGIGDVDLNKEAERKLVETWVKAQNKTEFSKRLDTEAKNVARGREGVIETARQLQYRERQIIEQAAKMEATLVSVGQQLESLTSRRAKLQQVIQGAPRTNEELYHPETGQIVPEKLADQVRARNAAQELQDIASDEQTLKQKQEQLSEQVRTANSQKEWIALEDFTTRIAPEFMPETTDLATAFSKYHNGEPMDDGDWTRMHELTQMLTEREASGAQLERIYQYKRSSGQLTVRGAQAPGSGRALPSPRTKGEDIVNRINRIRNRINSAPSTMTKRALGSPATVGAGGVKTPQDAALAHIQSEKVADTQGQPAAGWMDGKLTTTQRPVN